MLPRDDRRPVHHLVSEWLDNNACHEWFLAASESAETAQGTSPIPERTPHFSVDISAHREDDAFKARKTKAEIERLQAKIGQDILTLAHEDYGHQPVGKTKQMGFTFGDPKPNDHLTWIRFQNTLGTRRTGTMSGKIIQLRPHCDNWNLRLRNEIRLTVPARYPIPSECEWNPPGGLITPQAKYETLPTPPDT